jgi:hypothetical protein
MGKLCSDDLQAGTACSGELQLQPWALCGQISCIKNRLDWPKNSAPFRAFVSGTGKSSICQAQPKVRKPSWIFSWNERASKPERAMPAAAQCYSLGQKFWQTMDVSQGCKQAEYHVASWSSWLHAVMPALHSHGCRLRVSVRAGAWHSLQNCHFTAKNRPVVASIFSTQQ